MRLFFILIFVIGLMTSFKYFTHDDDREEIQWNIETFQDCLRNMANKDLSPDVRNSARRQANGLFKEKATMEVSFLDPKTGKETRNTYYVTDYFERLINLKYDAVEITFQEYRLEEPDTININHYTIGGIYYQIFQGKRDGETIYSDVTIKKIHIHVNKWQDEFNNIHRNVKFGKVTVEETHHYSKRD